MTPGHLSGFLIVQENLSLRDKSETDDLHSIFQTKLQEFIFAG